MRVEVIPMAEVGLVRCAQVAREVAEAMLPTYRSKYSKHLFTQPWLLAILCLMRYEDWTFREVARRKLSSRAPGRLPATQHLQVLLLGLAYDIYRVRRALSLSVR